MKLKGQTALVTGATGFIGSHLVEALLKEGVQVRALSHYRSDPSLHNLELLGRHELDAVDVWKGDVRDEGFVRRAASGCDMIFHLAALIGIPYSYVAPASYVATNVSGTLNVLEAARSEGVRRVIHTSTSECYGSALYTPMDETHPLQGQSPYSATKIGADKLAESYHRAFEVPVITVRPFNTFGPRQSARAVIPTIISQLLVGGQVRLGSLDPVRDLTYVADTVAGFLAAARAEGAEGGVFNLGTGEGVSIGELAKLLMEIADVDAEIVSEEARIRPDKSEVIELVSDNTRARERLGWAPATPLREGLERTLQFARACPEAVASHSYQV